MSHLLQKNKLKSEMVRNAKMFVCVLILVYRPFQMLHLKTVFFRSLLEIFRCNSQKQVSSKCKQNTSLYSTQQIQHKYVPIHKKS